MNGVRFELPSVDLVLLKSRELLGCLLYTSFRKFDGFLYQYFQCTAIVVVADFGTGVGEDVYKRQVFVVCAALRL